MGCLCHYKTVDHVVTLKTKADSGDYEACYQLAKMYKNGYSYLISDTNYNDCCPNKYVYNSFRSKLKIGDTYVQEKFGGYFYGDKYYHHYYWKIIVKANHDLYNHYYKLAYDNLEWLRKKVERDETTRKNKCIEIKEKEQKAQEAQETYNKKLEFLSTVPKT